MGGSAEPLKNINLLALLASNAFYQMPNTPEQELEADPSSFGGSKKLA